QRGDAIRQSAAEGRLSRRVLAEAGADDVSHDALVDNGRIDSGAPHGFGDDLRTEVGRGEILQRPEKPAGRRADRAHDDYFPQSVTRFLNACCEMTDRSVMPPRVRSSWSRFTVGVYARGSR